MIMAEKEARAEEMLSASQAGKLLGVSGRTMIRMMEAGSVPGYRIGSVWKFKRGEVEGYRDSRRYQPETRQE